MTDPRRALPAVGTLLEYEGVQALLRDAPRSLVTDAARDAIDAARLQPAATPVDAAGWSAAVRAHVTRRERSTLRRAINATGVVLHTNLGRAPLADVALDAMREVAGGFSTLEYDATTGSRGSRHVHCAALLAELTGAEDALVVNNCAAALVLALNTFADGRDAIISRGELVEIGGSFRVPDIMTRSGARLVEVGTTNRTHADDYRRALSATTGAIVSVHRSNFALEGFVASVSVRDLAPVAAAGGVPLLYDFGSGLMLDLAAWGLQGELTARDAVRAGASLVMMSGDKLLGGPQAGIMLGSKEHIAALRQNPLARALRVDKLTLAALHATLALYRDPARAVREIPALALLTAPADGLQARAQALAAQLRGGHVNVDVVASDATVGGGAFPTARIPSYAIAAEAALEPYLRDHATPIVGRVTEGRLLLDLRAVAPHDDARLAARLTEASMQHATGAVRPDATA